MVFWHIALHKLWSACLSVKSQDANSDDWASTLWLLIPSALRWGDMAPPSLSSSDELLDFLYNFSFDAFKYSFESSLSIILSNPKFDYGIDCDICWDDDW